MHPIERSFPRGVHEEGLHLDLDALDVLHGLENLTVLVHVDSVVSMSQSKDKDDTRRGHMNDSWVYATRVIFRTKRSLCRSEAHLPPYSHHGPGQVPTGHVISPPYERRGHGDAAVLRTDHSAEVVSSLRIK